MFKDKRYGVIVLPLILVLFWLSSFFSSENKNHEHAFEHSSENEIGNISETYTPSFFEKLSFSLGLANAYTALDGFTGRTIPYIEVVQHDDIAQLGPNGSPRKDYAPDYARMATVSAKVSGKWSSVFSGFNFDENSVVLIPEGVSIVYDVVDPKPIKAIAIKGNLSIDTTHDSKMIVDTIVLYPGGKYENKVVGNINHEVIFSGKINKEFDPFQMSLGFVTFGGTVDVEGHAVDTYAKIVSLNGTKMSIDSSFGWKVGDPLLFYEEARNNTLYLKQQIVYITSISGNQIEISSPIDFRPSRFVVMASRSVVFRTDKSGDRAQIMFLGNTRVKFKNVALIDMGRTTTDVTVNAKKSGDSFIAGENQIGRYPLHAHHLHNKFVVEGLVMYGERLEKVFYDNNFHRRIEEKYTPLAVYINNRSDKIGEHGVILWPKSHNVVAVSGGYNWALENPTGERAVPPEHSSGNKPHTTRIGNGGVVEAEINGEWHNTGWTKHDVELRGDIVYAGAIPTIIKATSLPIGSPRWGIVNHNSFGDIKNNVIVGAEGSGIVTEEGLEYGSIDSNLVIGLGGGTGQSDDHRWWGFNLKKLDLGYGGHAFWHASSIPELTNNIADGLFRFGVFTFYKPYDINASVPSINNANQFELLSIQGMPKELYGFRGFTNGLRNFDNNISYAMVGSGGSSLAFTNFSPTDYETTDPYALVSRFTSYHHGISLDGSAPITFKDLKLYGDGSGVGIYAPNMQLTLINSQIKGFTQGFDFDRRSIRLIDSSVDNIIKTETQYAKVYRDTKSSISSKIENNRLKYFNEAKIKNPDSNFIAVLDHENVKSPILLDNMAGGWASLTVDNNKKDIKFDWNLYNLNYEVINIEIMVPTDDVGVPATIPEKLKRVFRLYDSIPATGSVIISKSDIESRKFFPSSYRNVSPISYDEFINYLKQGKVLVRVITKHIPFTDLRNWSEAQGYFVEIKGADNSSVINADNNSDEVIEQQETSIGNKPTQIGSIPTSIPVTNVKREIEHTHAKMSIQGSTEIAPSNSSNGIVYQAKYNQSSGGINFNTGNPTMTVSRVNLLEDKVSPTSLTPGSYNNNPNDWVWDVTITISDTTRTVYGFEITDGEGLWSTIRSGSWPIGFYKDGQPYVDTRKSPSFGYLESGTHKFRVYAQQLSPTYKPVTFILNFDQGDSLVASDIK